MDQITPDTIRELLEERDALAAKLASYERDTTLTQEYHND